MCDNSVYLFCSKGIQISVKATYLNIKTLAADVMFSGYRMIRYCSFKIFHFPQIVLLVTNISSKKFIFYN